MTDTALVQTLLLPVPSVATSGGEGGGGVSRTSSAKGIIINDGKTY